jgi:TonB family protein
VGKVRTPLVLLSLMPVAAVAGWMADTGSGCQVFAEHTRASDKVSWTGPCEDGKASGVGVLTSSYGTRIEGEFREGRPYNARGREPVFDLKDGRRPLADVIYAEGTGTRYGMGLQRKSAAQASAHAASIANAVRQNILHGPPIEGNPATVVDVRVDRQGKILSASLVTSSGVPSWDEAVMKAIERTGSLPLDVDQTIPARLELVFRPR